MDTDKKVNVTGNISEVTFEQLRWLAQRNGISLSAAIDRAVANTAFLSSVVDSGGSVLTEDASGKFKKITLK